LYYGQSRGKVEMQDTTTLAYIAGFLEWCAKVEFFQALNYTKKRKHTQESVHKFLEGKGYLDPRND
jgi:hypothetical protein